MTMMVEAIVVAFCVGGAVGALVAMQLQLGVKHSESKANHNQHPSK